jgi:uncharacterized protein YbjT (DUF2867 family)
MKILLTGATGMVGEGVLLEAMANPKVSAITSVSRKACGYTHAKLTEIIHADLSNVEPIAAHLKNIDATFFCLGKSSVGMNEADYTAVTYHLTMQFAKTISACNPNSIFCFISGSGTDSSEKGKSMWARVKGKTENDLQKLHFKKVYNFRPGFMRPTDGQKNALAFYKYVNWMFPFFNIVAAKYAHTLTQLGKAMINVIDSNNNKNVIEVLEIKELAK